MDIESLKATVLAFVRAHEAWAPFVVGALAFAESLAFLSLLAPATVLIVAVGSMVGVAGLDFWTVCLGAAVGAVLGDWVSYELGRGFKYKIFRAWPLNRHPELVKRGETFFSRWGAWGIFVGRFFGPLRAVVPLIAGVFGMRRWLFQIANVGSAVPWAFVLLKFGDVFGEIVSRLFAFFHA